MPWLPDLSTRSDEAELMDALDGDDQRLHNTLKHFGWINRWLSPARRLMAAHFLAVMKAQRDKSWTLLDMGSGGGDLAVWFARKCARQDIDVAITCIDYDPRAIEYARTNCDGWSNIEIQQVDILSMSEDRTWDFVFTNHFLHHLSDEDIVSVLKLTSQLTANRFVLSDIHRSYFSYLGFSALRPVTGTNNFIYKDGRTSIRKSFTVAECRSYIDQAGLNAVTQRFFPGHLGILGEAT